MFQLFPGGTFVQPSPVQNCCPTCSGGLPAVPADEPNVPAIGAAASAENVDLREALAEIPVLPAEFDGIPVVQGLVRYASGGRS